MPFPYIAIEGVIGVGKTTLARYLREALSAEILLEVFEENPFLSDFYADRNRYAFQTQIFFLLSRYRQQQQGIADKLSRHSLVSDYMFAKDRLFANLNLANDELAVYERLYTTLAERIPSAQLVVYLRAGVDTLMERIAIRDRPYERNMSREYIADLHRTYDAFFTDYSQSPVITIHTDQLNIVQDPEARQSVIGQIKSALTEGIRQPYLPEFTPTPNSALDDALQQAQSGQLADFQQFHRALDAAKNFSPDLFFNFILLTEEVGELAAELKQVWRAQQNGGEADLDRVLQQHRPQLQSELADCLAYLLKLANYSGIDLGTAYLEKMSHNTSRHWATLSTTEQSQIGGGR